MQWLQFRNYFVSLIIFRMGLKNLHLTSEAEDLFALRFLTAFRLPWPVHLRLLDCSDGGIFDGFGHGKKPWGPYKVGCDLLQGGPPKKTIVINGVLISPLFFMAGNQWGFAWSYFIPISWSEKGPYL